MRLTDCAKAYDALEQMKDAKCSYKTAHAMMRLKQRLSTEVAFLQEHEIELAKKCAELNEKGEILFTEPGRFRLRSEKAEEYHAGIKELYQVEVTVDPVQAGKPPEEMTLQQVEALEGILVFEEV